MEYFEKSSVQFFVVLELSLLCIYAVYYVKSYLLVCVASYSAVESSVCMCPCTTSSLQLISVVLSLQHLNNTLSLSRNSVHICAVRLNICSFMQFLVVLDIRCCK